MEQRANGQLLLWANPFTNLRVPKIFNLRTDPYERADVTSNTYYDWLIDHIFLLVPAQDYVGQFLATPTATKGSHLQYGRSSREAERSSSNSSKCMSAFGVKRTSRDWSSMSANDPKRTSAVQDCCRANRPLNPISPVANPCCNHIVGVVLSLRERQCDDAISSKLLVVP